MNCHEIRLLISPVAHGRTSLTEWALVEAHLKHCADCRVERTRVDHEMAQSRPIAGWSRVRSRLSDTLAHSRPTAAGVTARPGRLGRQLRVPVTGAVDAVGRTAGTARAWAAAASTGTRAASRSLATHSTTIRALAARRAASLRDGSRAVAARIGRAQGRLGSALVSAPPRIRRAALDRVERARAHVGRLASRTRMQAARATATSRVALGSFSRISAVQVAGIALVAGLALYVLLPTPILRPDAASDVSGTRRPPLRPVPSDGGSRRGPESVAPRLGAARSAAMVATTSAQSPRSGGPHVVGRLTVRDRGASEEALTVLLARSGGARIGGHHDFSASTVYAVIPSTRYPKFVRGLTQIGSWQVDAERSPLPRGVRVAISVDD